MGSIIYLAFRILLRHRMSMVMLSAAVTCGVAFQIPNLANLAGYSRELFTHGVLRTMGHVIVSSGGADPLPHVDATLARLHALPFVTGATPRLVHGGVVLSDERYQPVRVIGIDPTAEQTATGFCDRVASGVCLPAQPAADQAIVGAGLARQLGIGVGAKVRLFMPYQDLGEMKYVKQVLIVTGILRAAGGFSAVDNAVFLGRDWLGQFLDAGNSATSIHVYTDDPDRIASYRGALQRAAGAAKVESWWEASDFVAHAIDANRAISFISTLMVLLAVSIPVLAVFTVNVLHERRQIATLAAIGWSRRAIFGLYVVKTAIIAVIGTILGVAVGLGFCLFYGQYPLFSHAGFVVRPALGFECVAVPVVSVFTAAMVAGLWPAVRAARANPALELRQD